MEATEEFELHTHSKTILGFWIYLMADCLLFTSLFATYVVYRKETFGGPTPSEIFRLDTAFIETCALLASSIACGMGMLSAIRLRKKTVVAWFCLTFALGATFLGVELNEFIKFYNEGYSWRRSAFLSSYFTLVGTHGLHVTIGLFWMIVVMIQILIRDLTAETFRRLVCLSLFWHFLDLVWVFIFTVVYLLGIG